MTSLFDGTESLRLFLSHRCDVTAAREVVEKRLCDSTLLAATENRISDFLERRILIKKRRQAIADAFSTAGIDIHSDRSVEILRSLLADYRDSLRQALGRTHTPIAEQANLTPTSKPAAATPSDRIRTSTATAPAKSIGSVECDGLADVLFSVLAGLNREQPDLIQWVQTGKQENRIRDLIARTLQKQMPNLSVKTEVAVEGKRVDLLLTDDLANKLYVEAKMAYAGALGSVSDPAPGLTSKTKGLVGEILKVRKLSFASEAAYLLMVAHFEGPERALRALAASAPTWKRAISAQIQAQDWQAASIRRVSKEISSFGAKLQRHSYVPLGTHQEVSAGLQFFLISG